MRERISSASNRAFWGLGDQVFSSITNFAVNVLIAKFLGPASFGAFSIGFGTYLVFLNLSRAVTSEPLSIRASGVTRNDWARAARMSSATALAMGAVGSLTCLAVSAVVGGDIRTTFVALAIMLPGLLHLDMWRFAFFAEGRGQLAMLTDVLWAVVMAPVFVWLLLTPDPSLFLLVLAWGGSATVAGIAVAVGWGVLPRFGGIKEWLVQHRDLTPHFVGEMATVSGASQLSLIGIGLVADLAAVGAYRAVYVLFGPLRVVYQGLTMFGVPEAVRTRDRSIDDLRKFTRLAAGGLGIAALLYGSVLIFIPDAWGEVVLGETWALAAPLAVPFTIGAVGIGLSMPTYIGLRALEAAKDAFRTRLVVAGLGVVATIVGAGAGGAAGAAWADRTWLLAGSGLWWRIYEKRLDEHAELGGLPARTGV